jgi:predicted small secreted protein
MYKVFLILIFISLQIPGIAQVDPSLNTNSTAIYDGTNAGNRINLTDMNGRSLKNDHPDISGSPYINENWSLATIMLTKGKILQQVYVKLNIADNELHYTDSTGKELVAVDGIVKRLEFSNFFTKDKTAYVFKTGYPAIDDKNQFYFYQALAEGKTELLARRSKYIRTAKDDMTGIMTKEYVDEATRLYVFAHNGMQGFNPSKKTILEIMKDKGQLIGSFIETNKINFKKTTDLVKIFNYYNSLDQQ